MEYVGITRPKIYKKQLIEVDGDRLIITGAKEVRSGSQLAFSQDEMLLLNMSKKDERLSVLPLLEGLVHKIDHAANATCGKLSRQLKLSRLSSVSVLDELQQRELAFGLIRIENGADRVVDLSGIGGPAKAGAMVTDMSKLINEPAAPFFIIDQSVTGMFERRTRVGL